MIYQIGLLNNHLCDKILYMIKNFHFDENVSLWWNLANSIWIGQINENLLIWIRFICAKKIHHCDEMEQCDKAHFCKMKILQWHKKLFQ